MADRWFRVPEVGTGTISDPHRPEFADRCDHYSAFPVGASPLFVMRAYADPTTLDGIAAEASATELTAERALELYNGSEAAALAGSGRPIDLSELQRRQGVR